MVQCSVIFIFTRPEPMNLDWKCDTEYVGVSQNLTITTQMVSKKSNGKIMQACTAHVSCCVIFIATSTAQWQLINNGISKPVSPFTLSYSIRGITACCHHPPLTNHVKKSTTVSLSAVLCVSPPFPIFSHCSHFQLNVSSVAGIDGPPLVHKQITVHSHCPPAHKCHRDASNSEFVCCFYPPHSQCVLFTAFFS